MAIYRFHVLVATIALAGCASGPAARTAPQARGTAAEQGYREVVRNNVKLYCRNEVKTGSIMTSEVCLTPEQYRQLQENARAILNETHRAVPGASPGEL